jgi:hypothetical protein
MTEWTPSVDDYDALDDASIIVRPAPRVIRRSALRSARSRRALYADARAEAQFYRGRDAFVWRGRVLPIGIPLAATAGLITWRRRRSARDSLAIAFGVGVVTYLEARVEWGMRRRAYSERRDS